VSGTRNAGDVAAVHDYRAQVARGDGLADAANLRPVHRKIGSDAAEGFSENYRYA